MAANSKSGSTDRPEWLDQVLGRLSPPFTFRKGGSAITGGSPDRGAGQQSAAVNAANDAAAGRNRQRG